MVAEEGRWRTEQRGGGAKAAFWIKQHSTSFSLSALRKQYLVTDDLICLTPFKMLIRTPPVFPSGQGGATALTALHAWSGFGHPHTAGYQLPRTLPSYVRIQRTEDPKRAVGSARRLRKTIFSRSFIEASSCIRQQYSACMTKPWTSEQTVYWYSSLQPS